MALVDKVLNAMSLAPVAPNGVEHRAVHPLILLQLGKGGVPFLALVVVVVVELI